MTGNERSPKRHYWVREDFDRLMDLLPAGEKASPGDRNSSCSLTYPKSTEGAYRELRLRGFDVDGIDLWRLAEKGILQPEGARPAMSWNGQDYLEWSKADIDAAAEWFYANDQSKWSSLMHFCWVNNLSFGQCVKAKRVAAARYGLGFSLSFDVLGLVTVIEPAEDPDDYGHLRLFPKGTILEPQEVANEHDSD